jgi:hypothetical protein
VFYRRTWNIVGKYSILCCDSVHLQDIWDMQHSPNANHDG